MKVYLYHLKPENSEFIFDAMRANYKKEDAGKELTIHAIVVPTNACDLFSSVKESVIVDRFSAICGQRLQEDDGLFVSEPHTVSRYHNKNTTQHLILSLNGLSQKQQVTYHAHYSAICQALKYYYTGKELENCSFICFDRVKHSTLKSAEPEFTRQISVDDFLEEVSSADVSLLAEQLDRHRYFFAEIRQLDQAMSYLTSDKNLPFLLYKGEPIKLKELGASLFFYVCFMSGEKDASYLVKIPCYVDGSEVYRCSRQFGNEQAKIIGQGGIASMDTILGDLVYTFKSMQRRDLGSYAFHSPVSKDVVTPSSSACGLNGVQSMGSMSSSGGVFFRGPSDASKSPAMNASPAPAMVSKGTQTDRADEPPRSRVFESTV